jgi:hypothetical protein
MTLRFLNPSITEVHHLDPQKEAHDRKCDRAANRYLRDQPKARHKPRRQKRIIRKGLAAIAFESYQGTSQELPPPTLIPRSKN